MNQRRIDDLIREWTDIGDEHLPDRYLRAALAEVETTPQIGAWRAPLEGLIVRFQSAAPYLAVAAAVIVAVVVYVALVAPPVGDDESSPDPSASTAVSPRATDAGETQAASPTADPAARSVETSTVQLAATPTALVATDEAIYASAGSQIVRIDPETGETTVVVDVPEAGTSCPDCGSGPEYAFAIGEGSIWVAYHFEVQSLVRRFSVETGTLQAEILVGAPQGGGAGASDVTVAFGSVWTAQCHSGTVARIDPESNEQTELIQVASGAFCGSQYAIAADDRNIWVSMLTDDGVAQRSSIFKLDPAMNSVLGSIAVDGSATPCGRFAIEAGSGVWINSCPASEGSTLVHVEPGESGEPPGPATLVRLTGYLGDPAAIDGLIWIPRVSSRPSGPAVLLAVDPVSGQNVDSIQLGTATPVVARSAAPMVVAFDAVWVGGDGSSLLRIPIAELNP
jgi:hypothetical protein